MIRAVILKAAVVFCALTFILYSEKKAYSQEDVKKKDFAIEQTNREANKANSRLKDVTSSEQVITNEAAFEALSHREKDYLASLRKKDPEKFKKVIGEKIKKKIAALRRLRETNPDKFKEIMYKSRQRLRRRLETLRKKHPEKFKMIMERRRKMVKKRLEVLKKENPQKFEEIVKRRQEYQKRRLERLRKKDPNALVEYLHNHPDVRHNWLRELTPEEIQKLKLTPKELKRLKNERPQAFGLYMKHHPYLAEEMRHKYDVKEDIFDRREDVGEEQEDFPDRGEKIRHREEEIRPFSGHDRGLHRGRTQGVRDHGKGIGAGRGRGSLHRRR